MMLRNLLEEIVRRHLWPIPLVAIAVALAALLLFLKSAPPVASPTAAVVPAAQADVPAQAQRLLTETDASATRGRRLSRSARDPFRVPASSGKASAGARGKKSSSKKKKTSAAGSKPTDPVPVVITNADGSKPPASPSAPAAAPSAGGGSTPTPSAGGPSSAPSVDVRFGARIDSRIQRQIPRLKTFEVGGKIAVVFVKYSPTSHKAIFAIDPSTTVLGDIDCRRIDGLCRYVDIPAGKYARLTFTADDGSRVSRRLDVVRVDDHA
jgi:hypothetical protein